MIIYSISYNPRVNKQHYAKKMSNKHRVTESFLKVSNLTPNNKKFLKGFKLIPNLDWFGYDISRLTFPEYV